MLRDGKSSGTKKIVDKARANNKEDHKDTKGLAMSRKMCWGR